MLRLLRTLLGDPSSEVAALRAELDTLKRAEAVRAAEWQDVLDRFERLFKRLAARQARAERDTVPDLASDRTGVREPTGESPLSLRRRLRG